VDKEIPVKRWVLEFDFAKIPSSSSEKKGKRREKNRETTEELSDIDG